MRRAGRRRYCGVDAWVHCMCSRAVSSSAIRAASVTTSPLGDAAPTKTAPHTSVSSAMPPTAIQ